MDQNVQQKMARAVKTLKPQHMMRRKHQSSNVQN